MSSPGNTSDDDGFETSLRSGDMNVEERNQSPKGNSSHHSSPTENSVEPECSTTTFQEQDSKDAERYSSTEKELSGSEKSDGVEDDHTNVHNSPSPSLEGKALVDYSSNSPKKPEETGSENNSPTTAADEAKESEALVSDIVTEENQSEKDEAQINEENENIVRKPKANDLFGDADDLSSSSGGSDEENEVQTRKAKVARRVSSNDVEEDEEEEEPVGHFPGEMYPEELELEEQEAKEMEESNKEEPEEAVINVEVPKVRLDLGNQLHFVKFPNFLSVDTRPFDPAIYEGDEEEDEVLDEEGRSRLKLKVENTIRWRNVEDEEGNTRKESNAKIVKWSDGSMSLYLGNEIFDIHTHPLHGEYNHLFIRLGTGLQAQTVFKTKLTFRPHSTESFTHKKMTMSMADRSSRAQKVKILATVGVDPEQQKQDLIKKEEERMRAAQRRESQKRRLRERAQMDAGYLDDDDELEGGDVSISALKRKHKQGATRSYKSVYSSDSDASEESGSKSKDSGESEESEDESEAVQQPKKKIQRIVEESSSGSEVEPEAESSTSQAKKQSVEQQEDSEKEESDEEEPENKGPTSDEETQQSPHGSPDEDEGAEDE